MDGSQPETRCPTCVLEIGVELMFVIGLGEDGRPKPKPKRVKRKHVRDKLQCTNTDEGEVQVMSVSTQGEDVDERREGDDGTMR